MKRMIQENCLILNHLAIFDLIETIDKMLCCTCQIWRSIERYPVLGGPRLCRKTNIRDWVECLQEGLVGIRHQAKFQKFFY